MFNALLSTIQAEAANYPFCTIEPNVGKVAVPDPRVEILANIAGSQKLLPTQLEFVDIAGLVRGASKGEGLGNQFLAHIREVDAIVYMLRCFEDENITHVEGRINPLSDWEIIETELVLADLESLEKRINNAQKKAKGGDKDAKELLEVMEAAYKLAAEGTPVRNLKLNDAAQQKIFKNLQLLTSKPVMVVCNVEEDSAATGNEFSALVEAHCAQQKVACVVVSAKIEAEVSLLESAEERAEFLEALGLAETGLARIISTGYNMLDLITFFTIGPKEAHAWTLPKGSTAPQAAGVIHTDFEKGFIRAETISYEDYVACKGESGAKEAGKFRLEGKEYLVHDGDVLHFRFNV